MAHFAKAKGGMPFHKREEERRWKDHLAKHKKNIVRVKPTIANKNDLDKHHHMRLKLKRLQIQEDRIATIDYENRRLLENITRIERKPNKEFWNEPYMQKYKHEDKWEQSSEESNESEESEDDQPESECEEDTEEREEKKREREYKRIQREKTKERRQAKREASLEHYNRVGVLEELKADTSRDENVKLEKRLTHMLKKFQEEKKAAKEDEANETLDERIKALQEAREALKKENEVMNDKPQKQQDEGEPSNSPRDHNEERIKENKRLHKKLLAIQKGKGRKKPHDPDYDGLTRWWVTSPRGREKSEYERERQKFIEDQKLSKEQQKIERDKEDKELMKKQKQQAESKKENVPDGYRKKKKKKRRESISIEEGEAVNEGDNEDDELPDTSILAKDPYGDNNQSVDEDKGVKKKTKESAPRKANETNTKGKAKKKNK